MQWINYNTMYIESPITIIMMIHVMYMGKGWGLDLNPVPTHTKGV